MGRKIPAKKHRGVKDPLVQQAKRLQELKGKLNAPPKDPDEQPVPKSLTQLFAFQNPKKGNSNDLNKKKKRPAKDRESSNSQKENPIAKLRKLPGESGRGFSLRINSAIRAIHNPTLLEDYPLDIELEDRKGEQMAFQRSRRKKKQKKMAANDGADPAPKVSRAQKLALKKKAKKEKTMEMQQREHAGEVRYERVSFGDVAHAPPALPVRPRHATSARTAPRPGRKELLLSAMLTGGGVGGVGGGGGKRQPLCAAEAERRERARLAAVAAYRALRARPAPPAAPRLLHSQLL